jgi:hypothetical protein
MLMALTLYRHSHTSRPRDLPRAAGAQRSFSVYKSHFVPVTQKFTFHSHNNTNKQNMFLISEAVVLGAEIIEVLCSYCLAVNIWLSSNIGRGLPERLALSLSMKSS